MFRENAKVVLIEHSILHYYEQITDNNSMMNLYKLLNRGAHAGEYLEHNPQNKFEYGVRKVHQWFKYYWDNVQKSTEF